MSVIRYRYRTNGKVSRSMKHGEIIERLATGRLGKDSEVQIVNSPWISVLKHPDFVNYFEEGTEQRLRFTNRTKAHKSSLRAKDIHSLTKVASTLILSLFAISMSYFAIVGNWFQLDYDPFVELLENASPIPHSLHQNLSNQEPTYQRDLLLEEVEQAVDYADPDKMTHLLEHLERQIYHSPQDEDAVYWLLLIRSLTWEDVWPDDEWMAWLRNTSIRRARLARLEAWIALRRGHREMIRQAVQKCTLDDVICQSTLWIFDGDITNALQSAKSGSPFAWRVMLDVVNNDSRLDHHPGLIDTLGSHWPQSDIPYRLKADLALSIGDWEAASTELTHINLGDNQSLEWALRLCIVNGDFDKALTLTPIDEIHDHENLLLLASAAIQAGKPADGYLDKAIKSGAGVKAHLLQVKSHLNQGDVDLARGLYAREAINVNEPSERFYAVYLGAILRNFRTAGQLLSEFPTEEPEYWLLTLHIALVREGPQLVLDAVEGLVQTDVELLWGSNIQKAWMPKLDYQGMAQAAKKQLQRLSNADYSNSLVDWGLNMNGRHTSILKLNLASVSVTTARATAALEQGDYELAVSESDLALKFDSNRAYVSSIKALAILKSGSIGRGESAMDAIVARGATRANARILKEGAQIRGLDSLEKEMKAEISIPLPARLFMEKWPQHIHYQLNEL